VGSTLPADPDAACTARQIIEGKVDKIKMQGIWPWSSSRYWIDCRYPPPGDSL